MTTYRTADGTTVRTWPSPTPGRVTVGWVLPSGYGGGSEADTEDDALRVARAHVDAAREVGDG